MVLRSILLLVLLGGCDVVFGLGDREPDASVAPCATGTPFIEVGEAIMVGTDGYSVEGARFSPDLEEAYLSLCRLGEPATTCDLYRATLEDDGSYRRIDPYDGLNADDAYDAYPTITADGQYFLWSSKRNNDRYEILVATAVNSLFTMETIVVLPAAGGFESNEPYLLGDDQTLYFASKAASGYCDLFRSQGAPPAFGGREALTSINTSLDDAAPVVANDELEIFYATRDASGSYDIFTASRASASDVFGNVQLVDALSDPGSIDWPLWLSPDRCTLFYINKRSVATLYKTSRR